MAIETSSIPMRPIRSRRGRWIAIGIVLAALLAAWLWAQSRPPDLMRIARRVPGFNVGQNEVFFDCDWISPTTVLLSGNLSWTIDAQTGARSPAIRRIGAQRDSPNGGWFVAALPGKKGRGVTLRFLSMRDRVTQYIVPVGEYTDIVWRGGQCAVVLSHSQDRSGQIAVIDPDRRIVTRSKAYSLPRERIVCFTGPSSVITLAQVPLKAFLVNLATGIRKQLDIFPQQAEITEVYLSPSGDRLLWYLAIGERKESWFERLLRRTGIKPSANGAPVPYNTEGIWISRADGSEMHELGEVPCAWAPAGFYLPRWMPDGRHISFLYQHGIYIVSSD